MAFCERNVVSMDEKSKISRALHPMKWCPDLAMEPNVVFEMGRYEWCTEKEGPHTEGGGLGYEIGRASCRERVF